MTLIISHHQGWRLKQSAAAVLALLMLVECVLAVEPETCYSRQHQKAIVNVRQAVNKKGVLMDARVVRSERDCVLACCSEEVKPGAKCNMVVYNGNKQPGENNCFLFHCPAEQDCPLMKAVDGINTYDIYKGLIHFTTMRPTSTSTMSTSTSSVAPNTPTLPPTTAAPTTTTATTTMSTTTQTPTTVPPSTTTTTTATTTTTQSSITSSSLDREPPRLIIITPVPAVESAMTTTTTEVTSLQKPNKSSKKQNKNTKKGRLHPVVPKTTSAPTSATTTLHVTLVDQEDTYRTAEKPQPQTESCVTTTTTNTPSTTIATTTSTPTTTSPSTTSTSTTSTTAISTTTSTTTTTAPTTTTTTVPPTTSTTTKELLDLISSSPAVSLLIVPKGVVQPELPLQDQSQAKATTLGRGAVKSGVVAFMVLGLAMLTMALAIGGRKAMESFDRRHYTRLELNDLHYEV